MTKYTLNSYSRETGQFNMATPDLSLEDAIEARDSGNGNFIVSAVLRFEVTDENGEVVA